MLDYGLENVKVHSLLPEMDLGTSLRIIDSDGDTLIMKKFAYKVKNYVLYFDEYNSLDDSAWEDIVLNPRKVAPERDADVGNEGRDKDDSTDGEFVDNDYEVVDDDDLFFLTMLMMGWLMRVQPRALYSAKGRREMHHLAKRTRQQEGNGMSFHLMRMSWSYQILMKRVRLGGI
jgi:hypothetical protein